jgi:hypothetical protein
MSCCCVTLPPAVQACLHVLAVHQGGTIASGGDKCMREGQVQRQCAERAAACLPACRRRRRGAQEVSRPQQGQGKEGRQGQEGEMRAVSGEAATAAAGEVPAQRLCSCGGADSTARWHGCAQHAPAEGARQRCWQPLRPGCWPRCTAGQEEPGWPPARTRCMHILSDEDVLEHRCTAKCHSRTLSEWQCGMAMTSGMPVPSVWCGYKYGPRLQSAPWFHSVNWQPMSHTLRGAGYNGAGPQPGSCYR